MTDELDLQYGNDVPDASARQELEAALSADEARASDLLTAAQRYVLALRAWKKACRYGQIGARQRAAEAAVAAASGLADPTTAAAVAWSFDLREYLASADWRVELLGAVEAAGMRPFTEEDTLVCPPVVVRALPNQNCLVLGKSKWSSIRPKAVAQELKRLRERATSGKSQDFVNGLYSLWRRTVKETTTVLRFVDAYAQWVDAPGWRREFPRPEFALAVYALDVSGVRSTSKGVTFELIGPSAGPKKSDILTVRSEDGGVRRYYGIRFRE